jgi:hypothetical protein
LVRIHGNWCGPNWTAGQKIPAEALKAKDRRFPCDDKLDCACRQYDISIKDNGPSFKSDQALQDAAQKILNNPINLIVNPIMYGNARVIRDSMSIVKYLRRK